MQQCKVIAIKLASFGVGEFSPSHPVLTCDNNCVFEYSSKRKKNYSSSIGHYIYFETSSPVKSGQQGIVGSKILPPTQGTCMSFYFSMYGNTMGSLSVFIQFMDNNNRKKVWEKNGNQGKPWRHAKFTIASSSRYKVNT